MSTSPGLVDCLCCKVYVKIFFSYLVILYIAKLMGLMIDKPSLLWFLEYQAYQEIFFNQFI